MGSERGGKRTEKEGKVKKEGKEQKRHKGAVAAASAPAVAQVAEAPSEPNVIFSDEDQKRLQDNIDQHLRTVGGLPGEESSRDMLAEFSVCMVVAKKSMKEIGEELAPFLGPM